MFFKKQEQLFLNHRNKGGIFLDEHIPLATVLNSARINQGYSILELAEKTGISASYISRLETGKRKPSVKILQKLAITLELDLKELLSLAGLMDKAQNAFFDMEEILSSQFVYSNNSMLSNKQRKEILDILR